MHIFVKATMDNVPAPAKEIDKAEKEMRLKIMYHLGHAIKN